MTVVLLAAQPVSKTVGGAEQYTQLLERMIPGLVVLYPDASTIPFFSEPAKSYNVAQKLSEQLTALNPTHVLYNGMYGWALPSKTPYKKVGLCHGTFASFARHAMPWKLDRVRTQFVYSQFERRSFENADRVISNSTYTQSLLKQDYGVDSTVIPLGTDVAAFHKKPRKSRTQLGLPQKPVVLFVGRPDYYKGFDHVESVARAHPEWHVVSVTSPRAHSRVVDARGPLSFAKLIPFYQHADVVFFPSRFESFGFVTIEALAAHKPIVTTPFGVARDIHHSHVLIPTAHTPEAFGAAIQEALALPRASFASLEKTYSLARMKKEYQRILATP